MPFHVEPRECPGCGRPFTVTLADRQHAGRTFAAKAMIVFAIVFLAFGAYCSFVLVGGLMIDLADQYELMRRETGTLLFLSVVVSLVIIGISTSALIRYANNIPRSMMMGCRECDWTDPCRILEWVESPTGVALVEKHVTVYVEEGPAIEGFPKPEPLFEARRERARRRRLKNQTPEEQNPDLDFDRQ